MDWVLVFLQTASPSKTPTVKGHKGLCLSKFMATIILINLFKILTRVSPRKYHDDTEVHCWCDVWRHPLDIRLYLPQRRIPA